MFSNTVLKALSEMRYVKFHKLTIIATSKITKPKATTVQIKTGGE